MLLTFVPGGMKPLSLKPVPVLVERQNPLKLKPMPLTGSVSTNEPESFAPTTTLDPHHAVLLSLCTLPPRTEGYIARAVRHGVGPMLSLARMIPARLSRRFPSAASA